jgi:hypothetical protein
MTKEIFLPQPWSYAHMQIIMDIIILELGLSNVKQYCIQRK